MADPVSEFELYRQELIAALNGNDPLAVLRESLEQVPRLVRGASSDDLRRAPPGGGWSPAQVLSHLADSDMMFAARVRMILTQDRPPLAGYDQEAWIARFGSLDAEPLDTLERWRALRLVNVRMFESLSEAEWERVGLHSERGEESARLMLQLLAGHDKVHLDQFRRAWPQGSASAVADPIPHHSRP